VGTARSSRIAPPLRRRPHQPRADHEVPRTRRQSISHATATAVAIADSHSSRRDPETANKTPPHSATAIPRAEATDGWTQRPGDRPSSERGRRVPRITLRGVARHPKATVTPVARRTEPTSMCAARFCVPSSTYIVDDDLKARGRRMDARRLVPGVMLLESGSRRGMLSRNVFGPAEWCRCPPRTVENRTDATNHARDAPSPPSATGPRGRLLPSAARL
jgi:hypothetical protein